MYALSDYELDPTDNKFVLAFDLEEYTSKEPKDDPRFVKWVATYLVYENS